jgi:protein-arginine kinase activator protein McsA
MLKIFRASRGFVCERCRTVHNLPYKWIEGKVVCGKCYKVIQDEVEAEMERRQS